MTLSFTSAASLSPSRLLRATLTLLIVALAPAAALARPTITNVNQSTTYTTIQQAVNASNPNDVIQIGSGVQVERGIMFVNKILTIRGQGPGQTIIDANHVSGGVSGGIFHIADVSNVTFEGLTIRNGVANNGNGGGAMAANAPNSAIVVRNCVFEGNGVVAPSIIGVIDMDRISLITFEKCIFRNNTGTPMTGISTFALLRGTASFRECAFADSGTESHVVYIQTISEGLPAADFVNCSFGNGHQTNCVTVNAGGTANVTNSVFGPGVNPFAAFGVNSIINRSRSVYPGATGNNINGVPTYVNAAANDLRLAPHSLGIDVGNLDVFLVKGGGLFDLANNGRLVNDPLTPNTGSGIQTHLDAGAYEFQADTALCPADFNGNGVVTSQDFFDFIAAFFTGC